MKIQSKFLIGSITALLSTLSLSSIVLTSCGKNSVTINKNIIISGENSIDIVKGLDSSNHSYSYYANSDFGVVTNPVWGINNIDELSGLSISSAGELIFTSDTTEVIGEYSIEITCSLAGFVAGTYAVDFNVISPQLEIVGESTVIVDQYSSYDGSEFAYSVEWTNGDDVVSPTWSVTDDDSGTLDDYIHIDSDGYFTYDEEATAVDGDYNFTITCEVDDDLVSFSITFTVSSAALPHELDWRLVTPTHEDSLLMYFGEGAYSGSDYYVEIFSKDHSPVDGATISDQYVRGGLPCSLASTGLITWTSPTFITSSSVSFDIECAGFTKLDDVSFFAGVLPTIQVDNDLPGDGICSNGGNTYDGTDYTLVFNFNAGAGEYANFDVESSSGASIILSSYSAGSDKLGWYITWEDGASETNYVFDFTITYGHIGISVHEIVTIGWVALS